MIKSLIVLTLTLSYVSCAQNVLGIRPERASLYDPSKPFTCLDGSTTLPFNQVNDDYCDCRDGSDEPGTSACLNGHFACENLGYVVQMIPSGRVNDGICDCCDGSDEANSIGVTCENTCNVLAVKMKEEEQKLKELSEQGMIKKNEMIEQGKQIRKSIQESIDELLAQKEHLDAERQKLEATKSETEARSNAAKQEQDRIFEELTAEQNRIDRAARAKALFELLDLNKDRLLTPEELLGHLELDILFDNDGTFTIEESTKLLDDNGQVEVELFAEVYYDKISPHLTEKNQPENDNQEEEITEDSEQTEDIYPTEEEALEEEDQENELPSTEAPPVNNKYDEETQRLIAESDAARDEYNKVNMEFQKIEREVTEKQAQLQHDLGDEAEFASLINNCYEFSDREYIYKLCPFNKCSQISKSTNSDTSIGVWSGWSQDANGSKYTSMSFTNGLGCWNGPQRSTKVILSCGIENKVIAVSEPNKCEYEMKFETPAFCEPVNSSAQENEHQEL